MKLTSWKARWILTLHGPPVHNGMIRVAEGRVIEVTSKADSDAVDLGDVCILPQLINAHTHLEFSDLLEPIAPGTNFCDWITRVVEHRRKQTVDLSQSELIECRKRAIQRGNTESRAHGVGLIVDMVTLPWERDWLSLPDLTSNQTPTIVTSLAEMMSFDELKLDQSRVWIESLEQSEAGVALSTMPRTVGLSPHAPYTMSYRFFGHCAEVCRRNNWLLSLHLAESKEEMQWLKTREGPFRALIDRYAPEFSSSEPTRTAADWIQMARRAPRSLIVHGNYLDADAIDELRRPGNPVAVVYCPRTHTAFRQDPHPWRIWRDLGIPILLGTDSRASNPDLSILEEVRHLYAQSPCVPPQDLFAMITSQAADFLGWKGIVGSIQPEAIAPSHCLPTMATTAEQLYLDLLNPGCGLLPIVPSD